MRKALIVVTLVITAGTTAALWHKARETSSVWGVLRDPSGTPLSGVTVNLIRMIGDPTRVHNFPGKTLFMQTDGDGRFEFPGLPAGSYRLIAQSGARATIRLAHDERMRRDLDTSFGPYFPGPVSRPQ